ncbi:MAG: CUAEP/CCAEP-tail radical SAM protein [Deltaproteobacteria bacterium]
MRVLLIAGYELGHQPLHLAMPAARLRDRGHDVRCADLSLDPLDEDTISWAERIAISVPMHTALRIARTTIDALRAIGCTVPIACYGLYASPAADVADRVLTGEVDRALVDWIDGQDDGIVVHLGREAAEANALVPARDLLPSLDRYVRLVDGAATRIVGSLEASHGCAHRCRHCPVPVIYDGRLRLVHVDTVLTDAAQQIAAGAQHLSFGDPDFLNAPRHALRVVRALHDRFPEVTFDCTTKVEHVLRHADLWPELAASGCLFVVSAFESLDDETLRRLDKGHTTAEAAAAVVVLRDHGIPVRPSWMPFTPWTTLEHIQDLLDFVATHDLVGNVDPVQYTIRLLLPQESLLLDDLDLVTHLGDYDAGRASYPWHATDPTMDHLQVALATLVEHRQRQGDSIVTIYHALRDSVGLAPIEIDETAATAVPHLTEPWFCCAEPTDHQLLTISAPTP